MCEYTGSNPVLTTKMRADESGGTRHSRVTRGAASRNFVW